VASVSASRKTCWRAVASRPEIAGARGVRRRRSHFEPSVVLFAGNKVNEISERAQAGYVTKRSLGPEKSSDPPVGKTRWEILFAIPLAVALALALHWLTSKKEPPAETHLYTYFLRGLFVASIGAAALQSLWSGLRQWMRTVCPLISVTVLFLTGWELATSGFRLLPMPYFPSPAGVLQSLVNDRDLLFDSTCHSLLLLLGGYTLGVATGLFSGVCIGWFPQARYWGMPVLKIVGPIPATAWIPLAMVLSPSAMFSAVALIALAVWFPVTMLTASGVSNTRASYLDVARTLGANRRYLIFRVAIPAAMPSIFIGLFMGLGASFLTLVVAETVGVKSGLGWYVSWAQGWAEYGKVYAALVIMAAFFSTIMTVLFKVRDRVLAWQKGVIKW
jgi:NitT/TauT family transport system permease protein